jgi:hypothetical protein
MYFEMMSYRSFIAGEKGMGLKRDSGGVEKSLKKLTPS